mgnify:CR=1 FL=1
MQPASTQTLAAEPAPLRIPRHLAIIMDGNGRWARAHGVPRAIGHRNGVEAVRRAVRGCLDYGIEVLTLYAFSSENWKRPVDEINDLMALLRLFLKREINSLDRNGVRVRVLGDMSRLSEDIQHLISNAVERTRANNALTLVVALNYGARTEMVTACRHLAARAARGEIDPDEIDDAMLTRHLQLPDLPDPDLIIRTSGEQRLSNFLLWQCAYAELLFIDTLWPDFDETALEFALRDYSRRERRFGGR